MDNDQLEFLSSILTEETEKELLRVILENSTSFDQIVDKLLGGTKGDEDD